MVDNRGFVCDLLKGRVTNAQSDGWIEFKIWNAQLVDTGYYRCIVVGTENHIYKDYYVEISGKECKIGQKGVLCDSNRVVHIIIQTISFSLDCKIGIIMYFYMKLHCLPTLTETSRRRSLPPTPLTTTTTPLTTTTTPLTKTIKPYKTSKTLPDATMANLAKDVSENSKYVLFKTFLK